MRFPAMKLAIFATVVGALPSFCAMAVSISGYVVARNALGTAQVIADGPDRTAEFLEPLLNRWSKEGSAVSILHSTAEQRRLVKKMWLRFTEEWAQAMWAMTFMWAAVTLLFLGALAGIIRARQHALQQALPADVAASRPRG